MLPIKTRKEAADAGENKYYTGKPCSHGHDSQRYTSTGICCKCNAEGVKKYNKKMRTASNAKAAGLFTYPTHPDDVAALLAYAQALDIQRGRIPHVPGQDLPAPALPFDAARARELAFGRVMDKYAPAAPGQYVPKP